MRYLFPLILICVICLGGCKKKEVPTTPEIVLTGTALPAVSELTAMIQTDTSAFFTDTLSVVDGSFELKLPSDSVVRINLLHNQKVFSLYLKGGDSVHVDLIPDTMLISGKIKPFMLWSMQEFLKNPADSLGFYPSIIRHQIERYRKEANKVRIGHRIPYALFRDSKGNNFSTQESNGKYRLITCWAGWDSLSTEQMKQVTRLAKKFENKAIDFINLSFDDNDSIMKKQVDALKLPGRSVFLKEGFASQNALKLGINTLPCNILVNPESNVIQMNLFGKELEEFLSSEVKAPAKKAKQKDSAKTETTTKESRAAKPTPDIRKTTVIPGKEKDRKTAEQPAVNRNTPRKVKIEEKILTE